MPKRHNPADLTLRNLHALKKQLVDLRRRVRALERRQTPRRKG